MWKFSEHKESNTLVASYCIVWGAFCLMLNTGVGYCLFVFGSFHNLRSDKLISSTLSILYKHPLELVGKIFYMKKFSFLAIATACLLLLGGCSAQFHQVSNQNHLGTQVVLSQNNFKVVGRVEGSNTTTKIFGIGGLSKKAMCDNAIANMFQNAQLTSSQAIANISFKSATAGVPPFYLQTTYTATGTIIEFTSGSDN